MQEQNSKTCTKCGDSKPATKELWNVHKLGKFGLNPVCKSCRAASRQESYERDYARQQEWKAANRERHLDAIRRWGKANGDYKKACDIRYRADNREKLNAGRKARYRANRAEHYKKNRAWIRAHPEQNKSYKQKYLRNNPDKSAANTRLQQAAKLRRTPKWLTKEQRWEMGLVYREARRLTVQTGIKYHVDHIVPLQGVNVSGLHVPWNLQVIPAEDNLRKSNRLVIESVGFTKGSRVRRQRSFWEDA